MAGKGEDGGVGLRTESDEVRGGGFITIGRTPDIDVGGSTEMSEGLDWLVGGTVLPETDRIVGGNPDNLMAGESREADGASSVRNEVLSRIINTRMTDCMPDDLPKRCQCMAQFLRKRLTRWQWHPWRVHEHRT